MGKMQLQLCRSADCTICYNADVDAD